MCVCVWVVCLFMLWCALGSRHSNGRVVRNERSLSRNRSAKPKYEQVGCSLLGFRLVFLLFSSVQRQVTRWSSICMSSTKCHDNTGSTALRFNHINKQTLYSNWIRSCHDDHLIYPFYTTFFFFYRLPSPPPSPPLLLRLSAHSTHYLYSMIIIFIRWCQ